MSTFANLFRPENRSCIIMHDSDRAEDEEG